MDDNLSDLGVMSDNSDLDLDIGEGHNRDLMIRKLLHQCKVYSNSPYQSYVVRPFMKVRMFKDPSR